MTLRDILPLVNYDNFIWLDDTTCTALGVPKNTYYRICKLMLKDELKELRDTKIIKFEPLGVGGFRVRLDTRL